MELENGNTEWRMATSSNTRGSIPTFIVESMLPKEIAAVCFERISGTPSAHFVFVRMFLNS